MNRCLSAGRSSCCQTGMNWLKWTFCRSASPILLQALPSSAVVATSLACWYSFTAGSHLLTMAAIISDASPVSELGHKPWRGCCLPAPRLRRLYEAGRAFEGPYKAMSLSRGLRRNFGFHALISAGYGPLAPAPPPLTIAQEI